MQGSMQQISLKKAGRNPSRMGSSALRSWMNGDVEGLDTILLGAWGQADMLVRCGTHQHRLYLPACPGEQRMLGKPGHM